MQQHPLPQNISSYQFHLIGDMTLKQFLFLCGGVGSAWFFYSLPLPSLFSWVAIGLSLIVGISFAFVPYQERPLDQWLFAFIKSIYHPTQFIWKKSPQTPEFLRPSMVVKTPPPPPTTAPQKTQPLTAYLSSLPPESPPQDLEYRQKLTQIDQLFRSLPISANTPNTEIVTPPKKNVRVEVRKLKTSPPHYSKTDTITSVSPSHTPSPSVPSSSPPAPSVIPTLSTPNPPPHASVTATTNINLPFPQTPTIPNIIVGMTLDGNRNILEGTIIEIRDSKNHPVRALKSNKLGQFYIATPLPNGQYQITAEKPAFDFDTININLSGTIIPPLEIRAKAALNVTKPLVSPTRLQPPNPTTPPSTQTV